MRGRIKIGALISQDHAVGKWPATRTGDEVDPDMEFDVEWNGKFWDCRADGIGRRSWLGESGGYGCGSIFVHDKNGIEVIYDPLP